MNNLAVLLEKYSEFKQNKEKLLADTFDFKNNEIPVIQMIDEIKPEYTFGDMRHDKVKMLDQQLTNIEKVIQAKTDFIPVLYPWHSMGVYASAFGCKTKWYDHKDADTLYVIDSPEKVYDLKPDLKNADLMKMTLDTINYFQSKVGDAIPIQTCDPNGPTLCASILMKADVFYMSLLTNKKEMHYLLDMITDVFIEFYERQLDILKNPALPGTNYVCSKNARGIIVSEDSLVQLPPYLVEEFMVPSLEKIAARFDGVYIHSCGNFTHNLDTILKIKGLRGINFNASLVEMDPEIVLRKIKESGKQVSIFPVFHKIGLTWTDYYSSEKDAYENYYLKKILYDGLPKGVFISTYGNCPIPTLLSFYTRRNVTPEQMSNDYDWIKNKIKEMLKEK